VREQAMLKKEEKEEFKAGLPIRQNIHSEIEERLISKLFTIVETIEETEEGKLDFKPYDDRLLIQIEALLEKKFKEKIFRHKRDYQISAFLEEIKRERQDRDIGLIL